MGEEKKQPGSKKPGQKFKSLLVWNILLKKTDENHALQIKEIVKFLSFYGITAERHAVKLDNLSVETNRSRNELINLLLTSAIEIVKIED